MASVKNALANYKRNTTPKKRPLPYGLSDGVGAPKPVAPAPKPAPTPTPAPAPAGPTPFIPDSIYNNTVTGITKSRDNTLAGLDFEERSVKEAYGLDPDAASNPFSRAKLLEQAYARAQQGATTGMAAQGQLYAGSLQNLKNANTRQNLEARDALERDYRAAMQDITTRREQTKIDAETASGNAYADNLARSLANRPDPMESPLPEEAPASAPASQSAKKPKAGFQFVQDTGPRAGLSYKVVKKGGKAYRVYENGDSVLRP